MRTVPLPVGWGEAALFEAGEPPWRDATRSRDHGGAVLAWRPPSRCAIPASAPVLAACDMERLDKDVGTLATRFGKAVAEVLPAWTEAEVEAKLHDEPIVLRLRRAGLDAGHDRCGCARLRIESHGRSMAFGLRVRGHGPP